MSFENCKDYNNLVLKSNLRLYKKHIMRKIP